MPFVTETNTPTIGNVGIIPGSDAPEPDASERPGFLDEALPAAFGLENTVGSAMGASDLGPAPRAFGYGRKRNPDFDPYDNIAGYEDHLDRFDFANDEEEHQTVKRRIDRERKLKKTIAASGWEGMAAMLMAGVVDPVNLIPVGGTAYKTYRAGGKILNGALVTGRAGLLSSTAAEVALHNSQETRTWGESAANVSVATFLSGVLGAGAGGLHALRASRPDIESLVDADLTVPRPGTPDPREPGSVKVDDAGTVVPDVDMPPRTAGAFDEFPEVLNHTTVKNRDAHPDFSAAKSGDDGAADRLVDDLADEQVIEKVSAQIGDRDPVLVAVRAIERDGVNIIPDAYTAKLARRLGLDINDEILQINTVGHTRADAPTRFGRQARFDGAVEPGRDYFLVDDHFGLGGTLQNLKGYIEANGGKVIGATTLTTSRNNRIIGLRSKTLETLRQGHGAEFENWWREKLGHGFDGLTEPEAQFLIRSTDADGLRKRIIESTGAEPEKSTGGGSGGGADSAQTGLSPPDSDGGSVGAASVHTNTLTEEGLKSALGVEKALKFQDPTLRLLTGPSIVARRVLQKLAENPLALAKNARGEATPIAVETRIKMHDAGLYRATRAMDDAFSRYRRGKEKKFGDIAKIGAADLTGAAKRSGKLTYQQFREEIGRAMRNGDEHEISQVAESAAHWRREVYEPMRDLAIDAELLPEGVGVETAISYLNRVYNVEKMAAKRGEFVGTVTRWLKGESELAGRHAEEDELLLHDLGEDLRGARRERRRLISEQRKLERSARDKRVKAEGKLSESRAATRSRETDAHSALDRTDSLQPSQALPRGDDFNTLLKDLRRGGPKNKPETLTQWARRRGGLADDGGELKAIGAKESRGLVKADGENLDDAALAAWEDGFLPEFNERPTVDDFVETLRDDLHDGAIVREGDIEVLEYVDHLSDINRWLDEQGADVSKLTAADLKATLEAGAPVELRKATPANKAKYNEGRVHANRAMKRLALADKRTIKAETELDNALRMQLEARANKGNVRDSAQSLEKYIKQSVKLRSEVRKRRAADLHRASFDELDLEDVSQQITDRIMGTPDGRLPYDLSADSIRPRQGGGRPDVSGPLKGRSFLIPDEMIEEFLESDVEILGRMYKRSMSADVEMVRAFGSVGMDDQIKDVVSDFNHLIRRAGSEKESAKLQKAKDAAVRDIAGVRDRLRMTYAMPADPSSVWVRGARGVKNLNYLRLLGGMTLSAIPDIARPVMVRGLGAVMNDGLLPLMRNTGAFRAAAEEVKLAGTALDMVLDSRTMAIADVMDDFGRHSRVERGIRGAVNNFGVVSLMAPWNAAMKQFTGVVTMTNILKATARVRAGRATAKEIEALASSGIDRVMARKIAGQFSAHGVEDSGVRLANTGRWDDGSAVEALRAAIVRDVDRTIVTPGQDKPLWMSTTIGSVIGQFKSFLVASTQRTLIAGLQQRDMAALTGATMMVGLGMLSYKVKSMLSGYETSDDPKKWILEGIDRSGLTGWAFDANNTVEKLTRGGFGLNAAIGGAPMSRFVSRSIPETLLGPSVGTLAKLGLVTGSMATGDVRESDIRAFRRLLPYQNLFYLRQVFNKAEAGIAREMGVKVKRK